MSPFSVIRMKDCVFCKIVNGEIPSAKIYEDNEVLAFLDIIPVNKGHTLVIPKEHHETLVDIPPEKLKKLIGELGKVANAVIEGTDAEGFNLLMNNKEVAGQAVPHAHFHIIPRHSDDKVDVKWPHVKYEEEEMEKYKKKIQNFLK